MLRLLGIFLGFLTLLLGVVGIFLPILPTTPFILLSGYLFLKTSPKLYNLLISVPRFGDAIESWNKDGTISRRAKTLAFISLSLVGIFLWWRPWHLSIKILIWLIFIAVLSYIASRPEQKV